MSVRIDRSRLGTLVVGVCGVLFSCADTSDRPEQSATAQLPLIYLDAPTTVETGTPTPREPTCPGNRLPDQCGGWAGVELVATVHDPASHSKSAVDEHCLCEDIEFQIPSELPVTSGNSGNQKATLTFRTDAGSVECRYKGNKADKYLFERCSDGSVAGQTAHADWFELQIHASNSGHEPTEVRLRLGEPDVVGGVVQEQIFYSDDPRIAGAALHVPRGAAPAFETFSLTVLPDVPVGTGIGNAGDGGTSVGFAIDVHADSTDNFTFTDVPGAACPRLELPYDSQALTNLVGPGGEQFLSARQLTTLTGLASGAEVLAPVGDATVDLARGTISFCVQHLSFYLPFTAAFNASLASASIVRVTAASEPPDTPTDLLASLRALIPGAAYTLTLGFKNLGSTTWDSTTGNVRLIAVDPPTGTYPNLSVTALATSPWGAPLINFAFNPATVLTNQTATFTFNVTCPAAGAPLNFCLRSGASNFFGTCFSWDLGAPLGAGSNLPVLCTAPQQDYYFDGDGDGQGAGAALNTCTPPDHYVDNNNDCCDSDSRARRGQTGFFTTPIGPGDQTACGGFDYNCDGALTGEIQGVELHAPQASDFIGAAQDGSGLGTGCEHDGWVSAIPACGDSGTAQECCFCVSPIFTNIENRPGATRACH